MMDDEKGVPRLRALPRSVAPPQDLWPGIEARLAPRRARDGIPVWAGFALAASLLAAVVVPLRQYGVPAAPAFEGPSVASSNRANYFAAQFKELEGAQREVLLALSFKPQSPALRRLLESTRQRQRELRRLALS